MFNLNYVGEMIIYNKPNRSKNKKNTIVAVGNFDGLHLGHKKVLLQAKKKAKKHNLDFGVVTFEPVPVMFFNKNIINHRINNFIFTHTHTSTVTETLLIELYVLPKPQPK